MMIKSYQRNAPTQKRSLPSMIIHTILIMQAQCTHWECTTAWDPDSYWIGIDNRASACISHEITDFVGDMVDSTRTIHGFLGSRTQVVKKGTLLWRWQDDDRQVHTFRIPNSYYIPSGKTRLLSPQHWAKEMKDHKPIRVGTGEYLSDTDIILFWNQRKHKLTILLSKETNISTFFSAPGFTRYSTFSQEAKISPEIEDVAPIMDYELEIETTSEVVVQEAALNQARHWKVNPAPKAYAPELNPMDQGTFGFGKTQLRISIRLFLIA